MSKAYPQQQKSSSPLLGIVIGAILMVAGTFVAVNYPPSKVEALHKLEEAGIPIDPGKTIATIGVFLILFPVINSFFLKPLAQAIGERNSDLERTFSEAESLRNEMTQMRSQYEQRLAQTEAEARDTIQSQIREAQQLRATLMDEATQKTDALVRQAQQEIAAERDRLITDLRVQVVDLSLAAAERVIGENMDTERNRRIVQDFINTAEAVR